MTDGKIITYSGNVALGLTSTVSVAITLMLMYFCPWPEKLQYYKSSHDNVRNFLCHLFYKISSRFQKLNVIIAEFDASRMRTIQSYNLSINYDAYWHVNSKPPLSLDIILLFINDQWSKSSWLFGYFTQTTRLSVRWLKNFIIWLGARLLFLMFTVLIVLIWFYVVLILNWESLRI